MPLHTHLRKSLFGKASLIGIFGKAALASAALSGLLFLAGAPAAQAADRDDCGRRIARAEHRVDEAIEHHGYYSRQADHQRHELREAYQRCDGYRGNRFRNYDRDDHRRYDRDWDRD
jgi:hypothetical protein